MKFDDVVVKESLSDWMFGDRAKGGGGTAGGRKQKRQKAPKLGTSGLTPQDKLGYKFFINDFQSDALSSINAGIRSGLINPPAGAPGKDDGQNPDEPDKKGWWQRLTAKLPKIAPSNRGDLRYGRFVNYSGNPGALANLTGKKERNWQPYTLRVLKTGGYKDNPHGMTDDEIRRAFPSWDGKEEVGVSDEQLSEAFIHHKMNYIVESIIEANGNKVDQAGGRSLSSYMKDWFGQWMTGVNYNNSKDVIYNLIGELERVYDSSKNPQKPVIDRNILLQLADAGWSVSAIGNNIDGEKTLAKGAENADGREEIEKALQDEEQVSPQAPPGTTFKNQKLDIYVDDQGRWVRRSDKSPYGPKQTEFFNKTFADTPQHFEGPHKTNTGKENVKYQLDTSSIPVGANVKRGGVDYTWLGKVWKGKETGRIATTQDAEKMSEYVLGVLKQGKKLPTGATVASGGKVAESKTNSALRAEKIALLQSR